MEEAKGHLEGEVDVMKEQTEKVNQIATNLLKQCMPKQRRSRRRSEMRVMRVFNW
ncbi:MAG: hypothetical protein Ct9H300mP23_05800 [Nitrospinota bacterium]|nr:MAG: hypothetical protein Ct9H300mP23_05800 [Nitrospinota bacterium]